MRISDWSSDVCSSDLSLAGGGDDHEVPRCQRQFLVGRHERLLAAQDHQHGDVLEVRKDAADRDQSGQAGVRRDGDLRDEVRSEEHTSELQSLMRISSAVFWLKKKIKTRM